MNAITQLDDQPIRHRTVASSGNEIHVAEAGDGPLVVFVHGFPESWYSWRHQIPVLATAGYRVAAIDVRGYGGSSQPDEIEAYSMTALVGDVIAVIDDAVGRDGQAVVIGHDWGAPIAWNTALLRPDRIRAVAGLSVPYSARGDVPPLDSFRALVGDDNFFYIDYFQEPGLVEAEVAEDLEGWIRGFYFTASGEARPTDAPMFLLPKGSQLRTRLQQPEPGDMAWMSDDDFAFYLAEFTRTGLTGGFNRYRNITRDWHELAAWRFAPITVPSLFIGGDRDGPTQWGASSIERFAETLPRLVGSHILSDCGHWVQQEKPEETNRLLLDFLSGLD